MKLKIKTIKLFAVIILLSMVMMTACNQNNETGTEKQSSENNIASENSNKENAETNNNETIEAEDEDNAEINNDEPVTPPDFELEDLDGNIVKLSELKGKKVMLNFWATWCSFCVKEMPDLMKIQEDKKDDLLVVYVNVGDSKEEIQKFIKNNEFEGLIVMDSDQAISTLYGITGFPTTFGINSDGTAANYYQGSMTYDLMEMMYGELK